MLKFYQIDKYLKHISKTFLIIHRSNKRNKWPKIDYYEKRTSFVENRSIERCFIPKQNINHISVHVYIQHFSITSIDEGLQLNNNK